MVTAIILRGVPEGLHMEVELRIKQNRNGLNGDLIATPDITVLLRKMIRIDTFSTINKVDMKSDEKIPN